MPFSLNDIFLGGIAPVIVTSVVVWIARRLFSTDGSDRHSSSIALLIGFFVGSTLLSLAPWPPTAHWHWFPYTLLVAAVVGPIGCAPGVSPLERWMLFGLVALAAGYLIVPDWEDLSPPRNVHIAVFALYVVLLACLMHPIAKAHTGPALPIVLWATMLAAAIVLALSGSLRFAQLAMALAGTFFAIILVACRRRQANHLHGSMLLFTIAAVGLMFIGRINSFSAIPLAAYLMIPAAPLLTVCGTVGPLAQLSGAKRLFALTVTPLLFLAIAVSIAIFAGMFTAGELPNTGEY